MGAHDVVWADEGERRRRRADRRRLAPDRSAPAARPGRPAGRLVCGQRKGGHRDRLRGTVRNRVALGTHSGADGAEPHTRASRHGAGGMRARDPGARPGRFLPAQSPPGDPGSDGSAHRHSLFHADGGVGRRGQPGRLQGLPRGVRRLASRDPFGRAARNVGALGCSCGSRDRRMLCRSIGTLRAVDRRRAGRTGTHADWCAGPWRIETDSARDRRRRLRRMPDGRATARDRAMGRPSHGPPTGQCGAARTTAPRRRPRRRRIRRRHAAGGRRLRGHRALRRGHHVAPGDRVQDDGARHANAGRGGQRGGCPPVRAPEQHGRARGACAAAAGRNGTARIRARGSTTAVRSTWPSRPCMRRRPVASPW